MNQHKCKECKGVAIGIINQEWFCQHCYFHKSYEVKKEWQQT